MEQKSIILEIEEAKQELIKSVNDIMAKHRLPCYLIEPVFTELYNQVKAGAQNELARAKAEMESTQARAQAQMAVEDGAE